MSYKMQDNLYRFRLASAAGGHGVVVALKYYNGDKDSPIVTSACTTPSELDYWCDSLIRDLVALKKEFRRYYESRDLEEFGQPFSVYGEPLPEPTSIPTDQPNIPDDMTEEQEIELRENWRRWHERQAEIAVENEQRCAPSIGYGTLHDDDAFFDRRDYTLTMDFLLPEEADHSCVTQLEAMVDDVVKRWLLYVAPKGTRTELVEAVPD